MPEFGRASSCPTVRGCGHTRCTRSAHARAPHSPSIHPGSGGLECVVVGREGRVDVSPDREARALHGSAFANGTRQSPSHVLIRVVDLLDTAVALDELLEFADQWNAAHSSRPLYVRRSERDRPILERNARSSRWGAGRGADTCECCGERWPERSRVANRRHGLVRADQPPTNRPGAPGAETTPPDSVSVNVTLLPETLAAGS